MFPSQLVDDDTGTNREESWQFVRGKAKDISREKTWRDHKEEGKRQFQDGSYTSALESFQSAMRILQLSTTDSGTVPSSEREILLSNIVACRLKIGGKDMASAAVEDAKQCVKLNNKWAKGYVRLASSYIALGGHSNDACNALQHAIRLDPTHSIARKMLIEQLRRDDPKSDNEYTNNGVRPNAPLSEGETHPSHQDQQPMYTDVLDDNDPPYGTGLHNDDNGNSNIVSRWLRSLKEQLSTTVPSLQYRYNNLSEEWKSFIKVLIVLLMLYVALGGRFGFDQLLGSSPTQRGDYGSGNAYDRYHKGEYNNYSGQQRRSTSSQYNSNRARYDPHYDNSHNDNSYNDRRYHERSRDQYFSSSSRRSTSYGYYSEPMSYGYGSSTTSMALIMLVVFALNRVARGAGYRGVDMGVGINGMNRFGGLGMLGPMMIPFGGFRRPGMGFRFGLGPGGFGGRRRWR